MNYKIRCSELGALMTEPKLKADKEAGNLSETAKTKLLEFLIQKKYGRKKDISNKYIQKGLMVEEDSITLYSRIHKEFFKKNEETLQNEFITGTPDIFLGENIQDATLIIDIKSSWDIFSFFGNFGKPIDQGYWWQLQGYMWLTGAKVSRLAYCLIDTPEMMREDEKRKLMYKMGALTEESDAYIEACEELEKTMTYSDIPMNRRILEFQVERDETLYQEIIDKVKKANEYLEFLDRTI